MTLPILAIIGDGPASLTLFAQLRAQGLPAEAMVVFGADQPPVAHLAAYGRSIRQRMMRSEGDAHLSPQEFPGLATRDALRQRSLWPLLGALCHTYRPSLDLLIEHAVELAERTGFLARRRKRYVARLCRVSSGFRLFAEDEGELGTYDAVVLAMGNPGLAWPAEVSSDPRIHHAYQAPPLYAGEHVVIVGGGMAAIHLWIAALAAGATVTSLTRQAHRRQTLNLPRCNFTTLGIERYRAMDINSRLAIHRQRAGSFPFRLSWEYALWQAKRAGRFFVHHGRLSEVNASSNKVNISLENGHNLVADRLICATGFRSDMTDHPLINALVKETGLQLFDGMLPVNDDFTLPLISSREHPCGALGVLARWALPPAETFAGMKIAARTLSPVLLEALSMDRRNERSSEHSSLSDASVR